MVSPVPSVFVPVTFDTTILSDQPEGWYGVRFGFAAAATVMVLVYWLSDSLLSAMAPLLSVTIWIVWLPAESVPRE